MIGERVEHDWRERDRVCRGRCLRWAEVHTLPVDGDELSGDVSSRRRKSTAPTSSPSSSRP